MAEKISYFITNKLRSTLQGLCQKGSVPSLGYIHSFSLGTECYLLSCSALTEGEKPGILYDTVAQSLPTGVYVTGLYLLTEHASDGSAAEKKFRKQLSALIKVLPEETTNTLLIVEVNDPRNGFAFYKYDNEDYKLTSLSCSNTDCDILNNCLIARLQANLPLTLEYTESKEKLRNDLFVEIERWKEELMCQTTAFHLENSDVLLFTGEDSDLDCIVGDIIERIHRDDDDDEDGFSKKSKKKSTSYSKLVMHLKLLCQRTDSDSLNSSVAHAPLIQHKHGSFTSAKINLPVDIVAYVHPTMSTMYLANSLIISICSQLNGLRDVITPNKMENMLHTAVPYHFKPASLGHVITIIYPEDKTEDELESVRKRLHGIFNLPADMPQVRRLNSFIFPDDKLPGGCIVNPHVGLPGSGVTGGRVSLVQGQYAYHHYMQDHMDDNGWGCAYRSLQTLVSWFRLQGYTDKPVPTHRDIQKILVDIGDKESNFINSKKWIGSTEVSFVLDHLLGVTSKILHVDSGSDLETKARDLAVHFDTQGTPIMIGGGVLAHTILGVHFNETTGAVKFLILDPHYTGGEDLKIIQDKGWCGWKDTTFWDKNAYYNLCMPQRPPLI